MLMGTPTTPAGRPPLLGENTAEELKKIGMSDAQVTEVKEAKAGVRERSDDRSEENTEPRGAEPDGPGPLQGIRVVDFSSTAVGPWSGSLLGLLGAHVIKVEPSDRRRASWAGSRPRTASRPPTWLQPGEEPVRRPWTSRTQKTTRSPSAIIKEADVLIENFRPGVMDAPGPGLRDRLEAQPSARLLLGDGLRTERSHGLLRLQRRVRSGLHRDDGRSTGPKGGRPGEAQGHSQRRRHIASR